MSSADFNTLKMKISSLVEEIVKLRTEFDKEADPIKRMDIIAKIYHIRIEIDNLLNSVMP